MKPEPLPSNHELPLRDFRRLAAILGVAIRYGWGHYVERLHLKGHVSPEAQEPVRTEQAGAARLRAALEQLGPTFIKFGQMLASRRDLLPEEAILEFQKLQDAVPPFPSEQAREIIQQELGRPVKELFAAFEDTPVAAASVAQAHHATLADGTAAIVKVQRPGIEQVIGADLDILFLLARLLQAHVPETRRYDPLGLVEEFAETITRELDFALEGRNADRFRANFKDEPAAYVPRVFWTLTGKRVLTMECSTGKKASEGYPANGEERGRLARELARLFLTQLFEHGFFHGDPHPGNVFVLEDGRFCFHDFGIVGKLAPRDQEHLRQLFLALVARDSQWIADVYSDMGIAAAGVDRAAFIRDLDESLEHYYAVATRSYSFAEILHQFIRLGRRHEIRVPRQLLLVAKAFMAVESQLRVLDPEFNMIAAWQAYVPEMVKRQLLPETGATEWLARGYRHAALFKGTAASLPNILAKALALLQSGEAGLRVRHEQLDSLEDRIDRASNRLSFSLIIAAIVIASSIVMSFHEGPHYEGIPLLGLVGYTLAAFLGLWWALAILRSGRF